MTHTKGHTIKTIYPTITHPEKEFGYHTYLNIGLEQGNAEWTCLCNNDLVFKEHWALNILQIIISQRLHEPKQWEYISASPLNPKEDCHKSKVGKYEIGYGVRQHITGWCLFQSRNVFDKIGKLEERIKFWFCDNWYAVAMQYNKIPHLLVCSSIVEHHNNTEGTTTNSVDMDKNEKHKITFGAGDEFREIIREMLGDPNWGKPTKELKEKLRKEGREWY